MLVSTKHILSQYLIFDAAGNFIDSNDSIFKADIGSNQQLTNDFPFVESILQQLVLLKIGQPKLGFERVEFNDEILHGIFDFTFEKTLIDQDEYILWRIYDRTAVYTHLSLLQQTSHDFHIIKEKTDEYNKLLYAERDKLFWQALERVQQLSGSAKPYKKTIKIDPNLNPYFDNFNHLDCDKWFGTDVVPSEIWQSETDPLIHTLIEAHSGDHQNKTVLNELFHDLVANFSSIADSNLLETNILYNDEIPITLPFEAMPVRQSLAALLAIITELFGAGNITLLATLHHSELHQPRMLHLTTQFLGAVPQFLHDAQRLPPIPISAAQLNTTLASLRNALVRYYFVHQWLAIIGATTHLSCNNKGVKVVFHIPINS